jgi:hypothetical protein
VGSLQAKREKVTVPSEIIVKIPAQAAFPSVEKEMLHEYCPSQKE